MAAMLHTLRDCFTLSGWQAIATDLRRAGGQLPGFGRAIFDMQLWRGAPMALARYMYQSPAALPFLGISAAALVVAGAVDQASGAVPALEDALVTTLVGATLGRAIFIALIEERNFVLARNIRQACLTASDVDERDMRKPGEGGAVVAILGMAHVEGVRDALLSSADPACADARFH